jgi:hypothetical protein
LNLFSEHPQRRSVEEENTRVQTKQVPQALTVGRRVWFHDPMKDRVFLGAIISIGHDTCQVLVGDATARTVPWDRIRLRA